MIINSKLAQSLREWAMTAPKRSHFLRKAFFFFLMKGFQNRGLEENAKCSRWNAHIKWKHLILEQLKTSLHGSRDTSYELMRSQVPESGSIWQPTAGLLTLIFSSVFRVGSAFWWVHIFVLVGLLLGGQPVRVRSSRFCPNRDCFLSSCQGAPRMGMHTCSICWPSVSYQEWPGDKFHFGVSTSFPLRNFFPSQSSRQMFCDKGGILHARKLSETKGLIRNRANLDLVCSIYNA